MAIDTTEPIAVVGVHLKFPGDATDPEAFYNLLLSGRSARSEVPKNRYNVEAFYHPDAARAGTTAARHAHFIRDDIAAFDAPFFSIMPAEAARMDPQQRLLLECVYMALENAGIPLSKAKGSSTSVHVGCFGSDYEKVVSADPDAGFKYAATGVGTTMLADRISWFYDFKGPSITLNTACSSSLMAVHLACNSLKLGEASTAVVAGCNLSFHPAGVMSLASLGVLSPDGISYSFDDRANGYSRGEGFGVVVLKRLTDAVRDGDTIRAVVRNTAANQDGRTSVITQPSGEAQVNLMRAAYETAGLDPSSTRYFEAHATGTTVGDPIEASAISRVFARYRSTDDPLYIGALKSNIGHLEGGAGVAALLKSIFVLERGVIPPNIWFQRANPKILEAEWHFKFPLEPTVWPVPGLRRASVNSFGLGGSNVHVIMDDAYNYLSSRGLNGVHRTVVHPSIVRDIIRIDRHGEPQQPGVDKDQRDSNSMDPNADDELLKSSVQTKCHVSTAKHIRVTSLGKKVSGANGQAYHLNGYAKSPENRGVAQTKQNGTISGLNGVNGVIGAESHSSNGAGDAQRTRVFVLSSFDERGVQRLCNQYHAHWTGSKPPIDDEYAYLDDLGYTLARKRSAFTWRAAIVANSLESLSKAMANPPQATGSQTRPNLALVFTGQGAQWAGMGKELLIYPVFRNSLSAADRYFKSLGCPWSLIDELNKDKTRTSINESLYSQPICSALQIAAMELLASWSISASSVIGHSSGEIAAAFAVGAISRESAWKLAYFRGLLSSKLAKQSQSSPRGMLAVALGSEQAEKYIAQVNDMVLSGGSICVACINSPRNVTISGSQDKLDFLKELLDAGSIFARRLQVDNAYHSMYMRSIADEYHEAIGEIEGGAASFTDKGCRFFSTVTGDLAPFQKLQDPAYWVNNLVSPVRFAEAASKMFNKPVKKEGSIGAQRNQNLLTDVLEVGPHGALRAPLREIMEQIPSGKTIDYGTMLNRGDSAVESALAAAGRLFCRGFPVDINALNLDHRPEAIPALLVNLPSYAFNHSETYWSESRLSKGYRFRKSVRHELLGAPIPEWNRINAVWRNHIRLSENPWAKDHSIMGSVLYPAAGMLVMAIEASLQLTNPDKKLKGFRFKDVSFHMALRIPAHAEGVETQFQMRPHLDSTSSKSFAFSEFELSSYEGDERRDHCRGLIQTEYDASPTPVDSGLEDRMFYEMCVRAVDEAEVACRNNASANQLYQLLAIAGYHFGPDFQTLSDIRTNNDRSLVATVKAPDIGRNMPHGHVQLHLIHPTTLDSVLQSGIVALTNGGKKARATMVPTFIKELWVAGDAAKPIDILRLCAKSEPLGRRQAESSITAINPATKRPLIVGDGVVVTSISEPGATDGESSSRNTCFNLDWKPDPSFVDQEIATRVFQPPRQLLEADPSQLIAEIECLCYMYMRRYMSSAQRSQIGGLKPHHQKFMTWMQNQLDRYDRGELLHGSNRKWNDLASDESYFVNLVARLGNSAPEAKLVNALGKALPEILAGDVDSLQILFEGQLINDVYHHTIGVEIVNAKLCSYLDAVAHKNPDLTILEVGAGTGAATVPIMDTLMYHGDHELGSARFRRYDFTDISPSFDNIKEMFPASLDHMHFRTLNIENDPIAQGFDAEQYDIIVASNVVHATKDIETTLRNMRKLLKPGGKLLLHEITNTMTIRQGFQFGLLPGWWAAEEPHRQQGPLLSVENWSLHLEQAGFSGVDISFNDYPEKADQLTSVMVSTAEAPAAKPSASPQTIIVADLTSALQNKIAEGLKREILQFSTVSCAICPFDNLSVSDLHEKVCIFVPEVETPFLDRMSDDHYGALQTMVNSAQGILWVGQGGGWPASNPFSDLVSGFSKVIRAEVPSLEFVTLAMESAHDTQGVIDVVARLFNTIYIKREKEVVDNAFFESDGILHIGRMIEANYMVSAIGARTAQPIAHSAKFGQEPNRALTLTIGFPGLLDTLRFDDDPIYEQPLKDNDVEFRVAASGLNFFDIMVALDQIPNTDLGLDGAGVVTRTGPGSKFKVGDRVCGIVRGSIKTLARASDMRLSKIPDELSFTSAASIPVAYTTAYAALYDSANIQKDETVLIHAAAGGVGQACIQLAQLRGAKIVATVGSVEKRDLLERKYGIPRDHILSSRDLTFTSGVKRITNGRGVDVIVNSLSGMALRETWNCIAPFGRFIELGKVDIYSSARLGMDMFRNNVSFQFIDIYYIADEKPQLLSRMLGNVMKLVCDGSISELTPGRTFLFSEIQEAFQYMRSGAHTGKIVLEAHDDDVVPTLPTRKPDYSLDPGATYVISGGLGGLGRGTALWMADRGARNLILLSRSGAASLPAKELVRDLTARGIKVATPPCDVTDYGALRSVLRECSTYMPAVKGCIQGAMVLKDSIFANMTVDEWRAAVRPKVHGSWNLHECLPKDLDFFVLLSSATSKIGQPGQSNYSAGNAFLNALARYRAFNGLRATTLDLGVILSIGFLAEDDTAMGALRKFGANSMREEEYYAVLDEVCNPNTTQPSLLKSCLTLNLATPEGLRLSGIDQVEWMTEPLFRHLFRIRPLHRSLESAKTSREHGSGPDGTADEFVNARLALSAAESHDAAAEIVYNAFVAKICKSLNIGKQTVDGSRPLHALGVDSLVAIELRTWVVKEVGAEVTPFDLMESGSIHEIASLAASRSSFVKNFEGEE